MKKKEYTTPKIEVVEIESENVISASGAPTQGDNGWGGGLNTKSSAPAESRTNFYDRYSK